MFTYTAVAILASGISPASPPPPPDWVQNVGQFQTGMGAGQRPVAIYVVYLQSGRSYSVRGGRLDGLVPAYSNAAPPMARQFVPSNDRYGYSGQNGYGRGTGVRQAAAYQPTFVPQYGSAPTYRVGGT